MKHEKYKLDTWVNYNGSIIAGHTYIPMSIDRANTLKEVAKQKRDIREAYKHVASLKVYVFKRIDTHNWGLLENQCIEIGVLK